jgi:uncharacterized membrane protein
MKIKISTSFLPVLRGLGEIINRGPMLVLVIAAVVIFEIFASYAILRHLAFLTLYFDLGLNANSIWRTLSGYDSWWQLILPSTPGHIGHVSPILAPVALLYYVFPDPVTLLIIQSAVLAISIVPLYYIAFDQTGVKSLSLLIVGLYLSNPALHGIARYDFHVESFLPLFIFLTYYSYHKGRAWLFYLSMALMLMTIEYSAIIGLGIAFSTWLDKRRLDKYVFTAALSSMASLGVAALTTSVLTPGNKTLLDWLYGNVAFGVGIGETTDYYKTFIRLLTNPMLLLTALQFDIGPKLFYLFITIGPATYALLRFPSRLLPAFPWLIIVLTSSTPAHYSIDFQYSAFVIPFTYIAAIPVFHRIYSVKPAVLTVAILLLALMLIYSVLSPIRFSHDSLYFAKDPWLPQPSPLLGPIEIVRGYLPPHASVLTQMDIFPHLSNTAATINHSSSLPPRYIVINEVSPLYDWTTKSGYSRSVHEQTSQLMKTYSYGLILAQGGLQFYGLGYTELPVNFLIEEQFDFLNKFHSLRWLANSESITSHEYAWYNGSLIISGRQGLAGNYLLSVKTGSQTLLEVTFTIHRVWNEDNWAGVAVRFKDPDNYYLFYLRTPSGNVDVVKRLEGRNVIDYTLGSVPLNLITETDYRIRILLSGTSAKVWVNGILAGEYEGLRELSEGGVALLAFHQDLSFKALTIAHAHAYPTQTSIEAYASALATGGALIFLFLIVALFGRPIYGTVHQVFKKRAVVA